MADQLENAGRSAVEATDTEPTSARPAMLDSAAPSSRRDREPMEEAKSKAEAPFAFPFRTDRACYVYDTNTNRILKVTDEVYNSLQRVRQNGWPADPGAEAANDPGFESVLKLREQGLLLGPGPRPRSPVRDRAYLESMMRTELSQLTFETTEACNLRCRYCVYGTDNYLYQRTHGSQPIDLATVEKALDYFFSHNKKARIVSVGFYGGEPLIAFDLIKQASGLVRNNYGRGPDVHLHLTTNGTLLTREKWPFLVDNGFALLVSVDGPQRVHDRYRRNAAGKGTYKRVMENLAALRKYAPRFYEEQVAFSCVRTPAASPKELREFFTTHPVTRGQRVQVSSVTPGCADLMAQLYADAEDPERLRNEQTNLFEHYLTKVISKRRRGAEWDYLQSTCSSALVRLHRRQLCAGPGTPTGLNGMCIPAWRKLYVARDGTYYTCERVGRSRPIGHVDTGLDTDPVFDYLEKHWRFTDEHCTSCWAIRLCGACQSTIGGPDGIEDAKVKDYCAIELAQLKQTIRLYTEMLEADPKAFDFIEEMHIS